MNKELFYQIIDIEEPSDFKYYDNIENLIESDEEWDADILYTVLNGADSKVVAEIIDEYFNELMDKLPEDEIDLYTMIYNVNRGLKGIAKGKEEDYRDVNLSLSEELWRFWKWFSVESVVNVKDEKTGEMNNMTLRDAVGLIRLEKLGLASCIFDFEKASKYQMNEYVMNYTDIDLSDVEEDYNV
ncbi:hypothetical protein ACGCUQ_03720 [Eubacteriales bacterium KG127]